MQASKHIIETMAKNGFYPTSPPAQLNDVAISETKLPHPQARSLTLVTADSVRFYNAECADTMPLFRKSTPPKEGKQ